jgi:hypothetical protein
MGIMDFDADKIITDLERNSSIIYELLRKTPKEEYQFRPAEGKWSLLEVICHLKDEEIEDFRARVESTLSDPNQPLKSIDPVGWVQSRKYADQSFSEILGQWREERNKNIQWLKGLKAPNWQNAYQHPKFGPMSAQLFLCNWLSHDYHHIRQIITIKRAFIIHSTGENLRYAGEW